MITIQKAIKNKRIVNFTTAKVCEQRYTFCWLLTCTDKLMLKLPFIKSSTAIQVKSTVNTKKVVAAEEGNSALVGP